MVTGCRRAFLLILSRVIRDFGQKMQRGSNGIRVRGDLLAHSRALNHEYLALPMHWLSENYVWTHTRIDSHTLRFLLGDVP